MRTTDLPLVVGVDGSVPSLRAVDWAADEAALRGAPLRLVYASLWEPYDLPLLARDLGRPSGQECAQRLVDAAGRRACARRPGLSVTAEAPAEEPEYFLVQAARTAAAVVVGGPGHGGITGLLPGSVALFVAAHAPCPVIVLPGPHDGGGLPPAPHARIAVGVADASGSAVRFAAAEARLRGVPLVAVRAWRGGPHETPGRPPGTGEPERSHEERAAAALEAALRDVPPEVKTEPRTVRGPARRALLAVAETSDLLVVGARRPTGHVGPRLGRVTHAVLHHAACPVAVVPEPS
ncbi:universal stress protein [Streptomyces tropicalis]|uniref:Universal stress protein n=1 Tax=Streptomyces tropicalis TaxID=3034234 RepID=A0ABT6AAY5_9ACTN|nr:universal stress protein [Streptomyces tropicalis]MDF3301491.1 universal stress protein [Streptomyces tropicalis]